MPKIISSQARTAGFIEAMECLPVPKLPDGSEWTYELKLDGYRMEVVRAGTQTTLYSRRENVLKAKFPYIASALQALPQGTVIDGELVAHGPDGKPNFNMLQNFRSAESNIHYFAFDILHLNGYNLRELPLIDRKRVLEGIFTGDRSKSPLRISEFFEAKGSEVFRKACALGAEGIVSKLASGKYLSERGAVWRKSKCILEQEFVVVGFTLPSKGGSGIGALLLGYYDAGKLRYAGRTGTGFTQKTSADLRSKLNELVQKKPILDPIPVDARRGVYWVKPELVAQVAFATWTKDNLVRQAAFKGLREDKPAREVERESAVRFGSPAVTAKLRRRGNMAYRERRL